MRIAAFTPYGTMTQESNLIHLLANYLNTESLEITQFRCNGVFSLCDRDKETNWRRELNSCTNCTVNQKGLQNWASAGSVDLSGYLNSDEVQYTKREMQVAEIESLKKLAFKGINIYSICRDYFVNRLGVSEPELNNKKNEQIIRRAMLSSLRMVLAAQRFNNNFAPDLTLVASGKDLLSAAYIAISKVQKREICVFNFSAENLATEIKLISETEKTFESQLAISDILEMRSDSKTWPFQIIAALDEIKNFLQISSEPSFQLQLAK